MRNSFATSSTRASISRRGTPWHFSGKPMLLRTFMCGYSANSWNTKPMSRCDARLKVTSSPSSSILPDEGSSSPAIIRNVVVLPQPEGPSSTKNSPSAMVNDDVAHRGEIAEALLQVFQSYLGHGLLRKVTGDDEPERSGQDHRERPGVELERKRLHLHQDTHPDDDSRRVLPGPAAQNASRPPRCCSLSRSFSNRSEGDAAQ